MDNPGFACDFKRENAFNFLIECPINEHIRHTLFITSDLRSY